VELRAVSDAGEVRAPFDWKDVEVEKR